MLRVARAVLTRRALRERLRDARGVEASVVDACRIIGAASFVARATPLGRLSSFTCWSAAKVSLARISRRSVRARATTARATGLFALERITGAAASR